MNNLNKIKKQINLITIFLFMALAILSMPNVSAVGSVPQECLTVSNANPKKAPTCNSSCTSTNCISYCASYKGSAAIKVPFDMTNIVVKVKAPVRPIYVTVQNTSIKNALVNSLYKTLKDTSKAVFKKGETLRITIRDKEGYALGFRSPNSNNVCGENNICREDANKNNNPPTYGTFSIADIIAPPTGYKLVSKQCYADSPIGDSDFDFNDYAIVIFGEPVKVIPQDEPVCLGGKVTTIKGGVGSLTAEFVCEPKNATHCELDFGDKSDKATTKVENNVCKFTHTYKKPGTYKPVCVAINGTKRSAPKSCTEITVAKEPHMEDTAGGFLVPTIIGVGATVGLAFLIKKKLAPLA